MKSLILFVALLGAAFATQPVLDSAVDELSANPYRQAIADLVFGWTYPAISEVCKQKLPSLITKEKAFYSSLLTFDFAQIENAFSSLYNSYITTPQCSYGNNLVTLFGVIAFGKVTYLTLQEINQTAATAFGLSLTFIYYALTGLETVIQTAYVVLNFYGLLTNASNVSSTQIAYIVAFLVRLFLRSLLIDATDDPIP